MYTERPTNSIESVEADFCWWNCKLFSSVNFSSIDASLTPGRHFINRPFLTVIPLQQHQSYYNFRSKVASIFKTGWRECQECRDKLVYDFGRLEIWYRDHVAHFYNTFCHFEAWQHQSYYNFRSRVASIFFKIHLLYFTEERKWCLKRHDVSTMSILL